MRVCISYTHPYPIKSLNNTLPSRICKLCFQANMQFTSTLRPDIKSQKLSEHRFRLRWTKSDARTQFKQVKTGQPQCGSDKEAQYSLPEEVGGGWWPGQDDRPTWLADQARGPHCLNQGTWHFPVGPYVGCAGFTPWLPAINTSGVENRTHTPHLSFPLLHSLHSL